MKDRTISYLRVLPRDAFNEANLLKCIGKLTLLIEDGLAPDWVFEYDNSPFDIQQSDDDGSIFVANIQLRFRGDPVRVFRPLNARDAWPLYAESGTGDSFSVFTESGALEQAAVIQ